MALEDVAHRLRTDRQAQVGQGADDPVIAPGAILLGDADNQRFELLGDFGAAWRLPLLGAIKLLGDQCAVPAEDRIGLDNGGDFRQRLLTELMANLRGFLPPFGDITLWNILAFCVVLPYISLYPCMTNWMLWGHILSVAQETASMEGGTRFRLNTGHYRPDSLVTGCHRAAP
jgi:hypothetical protein